MIRLSSGYAGRRYTEGINSRDLEQQRMLYASEVRPEGARVYPGLDYVALIVLLRSLGARRAWRKGAFEPPCSRRHCPERAALILPVWERRTERGGLIELWPEKRGAAFERTGASCLFGWARQADRTGFAEDFGMLGVDGEAILGKGTARRMREALSVYISRNLYIERP